MTIAPAFRWFGSPRDLEEHQRMKNSNRCPKCGGSDLIKIRETSGGEGNYVQTGFTVFHRVHLTRFLCSNCGFSEDWVESAEDLEKLKRKFGT